MYGRQLIAGFMLASVCACATSPAAVSKQGDAPGPLPHAVPSAGCAAPSTRQEELWTVFEDHHFGYIVSLPPGYRAHAPYPLGFMFHGYRRTHEQCRNQDCRGVDEVMHDKAILVYVKSQGPGWRGPFTSVDVAERNARFFGELLATMKRDYCVDESRVFVGGTSSGAVFANLVGCRYGDQLLAVAPVAGLHPQRHDCKGRPAAIVIHGIDDHHVPFRAGELARDFYVERNECSPTAQPDLAAAHARVRAARDKGIGEYACVDYPDCAAGAVRWCEHGVGGYDNSTHGWPLAGGRLIWEFVESLRK